MVGRHGREAARRRGEGGHGGAGEPEPQAEGGLEGRHAHELLLRRVRLHLPEARLHVLRLALHDESLNLILQLQLSIALALPMIVFFRCIYGSCNCDIFSSNKEAPAITAACLLA